MTSMFKRIYSLLLPKERKTAVRTSIAIFFNALLDFASVAALLPVLYFLLEGMDNSRAALFFCTLATVVIITKCVVSTFLTRYQNRFLLSLYKRLSLSLYSSYYRKGLLYIREQGTPRLGYEVNVVCFAFSLSLLSPMATMASDLLLIVLITVSLLIYAPVTAVILILAFIPFVVVYIRYIRKKVRYYGEQEMLAKRTQTRLVSDTFNGYAELQVSNAFPIQKDSFKHGMDAIVESRLKMTTITQFPAALSELAVIVGLTILVLFGGSQATMLVAAFAVGAFKLLPAMRSILSGWTQIQNAESSLQILEEGLKDFHVEEEDADAVLPFEKEIGLSDISYSYPGGETIFRGFNAVIRKGEYIGISGVSGAGKSTLFNILLGFLEPDRGTVSIDGVVLDRDNQASWLKHIGYVSQEVFIFNASLAENVALGFKDVDRDRINRIMKQVCLDEWLETLPKGIDTELGDRGCKVSGGQRQRIGIARAIYKKIDVLLLDEATSALDNRTEKDINETLSSLREQYSYLTILSIAHRESSLNYCDRIINIENI